MSYSVAIFDLDGTLLDTLEDLYLSVNRALSRHHLPTRTRDEVRTFVGDGVEMLVRRAVPATVGEEEILSVLADFKTIYADTCDRHTAPYAGICSLLRALREGGVRVAVVSNKFDAAVKRLCQNYFGELIDVAVGEHRGIPKKPSPEIVFEALRALGAAVGDAVYIGDSDVDIQTAKNAGMDCISVTWGFRDEAFLVEHGAGCLARSTTELQKWILNP